MFVLLLFFLVSTSSDTNTTIRCDHGIQLLDECHCDELFTGVECNRPMHCFLSARHPNQTCIKCHTGWMGEMCDRIQCHHTSTIDANETSCICEPPYSGMHCDQLTTANIYYYYNRKLYNCGPIGVLIIVPIVLVYCTCQMISKRKNRQRMHRSYYQRLTSTPPSIVVVDCS